MTKPLQLIRVEIGNGTTCRCGHVWGEHNAAHADLLTGDWVAYDGREFRVQSGISCTACGCWTAIDLEA